MTTPQPRTRKSWDTILTIVLLILGAGWSIVCAFSGAIIAFVGASCGASAVCNYDQIGTALYVGVGGPLGIGVIVLIVTIVRLLRKRLAFFIPIIGIVLAPAIVVAAYVTAVNAVVPLK
jgi:hypothetical protein